MDGWVSPEGQVDRAHQRDDACAVSGQCAQGSAAGYPVNVVFLDAARIRAQFCGDLSAKCLKRYATCPLWFKREASTLLTLEHPGIPAIYTYWTAQRSAGPFYLAMEYVPGRTLEGVLQDTVPEPDRSNAVDQFTCAGDAVRLLRPYLTGRGFPGRVRRASIPSRAQTAAVIGRYTST
jgi:serine/threonine protein kinase